jgi:UDP-galactose transporter B1
MIFGAVLGQKYTLKKMVNVALITVGVALFMGGGTSTAKHTSDGSSSADTTMMGAIILSISLCFDGATGAYEDKLMSGSNKVGPFDLMFNIQLGKSVISFCTLIVINGISEFVGTIQDGGWSLVLLGLTGALGQVTD